jgi:hypothetical protein
MAMTKEEHTLMIMMFARMNEGLGAIRDILRSRGIISGDDLKAFRHAVYDDAVKIHEYFAQARMDYLTLANQQGVKTDI